MAVDVPAVPAASERINGEQYPAVSVAPQKLALQLRSKLAAELTDAELLTLLLGARHQSICARLTATYDLRSLAAAHPLDLREHGLTTSAIDRLSVIFELAKRFAETEWKVGESFRGDDVYGHFRERLGAEMIEHFYLVLLDNKHRKIREVLVSKGSLTASIVHPRDVFVPVVKQSAAAIVLVHNHPAGHPAPSKEDIEITRRLRKVGDLMGVRVLDHIVIGRGRYVSFAADGYW
jgi:DNA repair protein RadC